MNLNQLTFNHFSTLSHHTHCVFIVPVISPFLHSLLANVPL